ncbi:MAG: IS3 family transposase [Bacteroidetes bacterium]|nr:IS3 family transposase [Bacteroidota bacterium]
MIEPEHEKLSINQQCILLGISRSSYYYEQRPIKEVDLDDIKKIIEVYNEYCFYGYRKITKELKKQGHKISAKRTRRLMHRIGLQAIRPKPNTSKANKEHEIHSYKLRNKSIRYPNQAWCTDYSDTKVIPTSIWNPLGCKQLSLETSE